MKDETAGVAIKEFVGLNLKMYSFLVDDSSEHKKAKGFNKNPTTSDNKTQEMCDKAILENGGMLMSVPD